MLHYVSEIWKTVATLSTLSTNQLVKTLCKLSETSLELKKKKICKKACPEGKPDWLKTV